MSRKNTHLKSFELFSDTLKIIKPRFAKTVVVVKSAKQINGGIYIYFVASSTFKFQSTKRLFSFNLTHIRSR